MRYALHRSAPAQEKKTVDLLIKVLFPSPTLSMIYRLMLKNRQYDNTLRKDHTTPQLSSFSASLTNNRFTFTKMVKSKHCLSMAQKQLCPYHIQTNKRGFVGQYYSYF